MNKSRFYKGASCLLVLTALILSLSTRSEEPGPPGKDRVERMIELGSAERIVTIPMPAAPMLIALEQGVDSLIAMHPESRTAVRKGLLGALFPQALDLPTDVVGRGFMPNVEAVLRLSPDLVIQWGDRGEDLIKPLEAAGLTVAPLNYQGREEDVRAWLRLFGQVLGEQERAARLIGLRDEVQARLAPLREMPETEKPRVLYLFRVLSGFQAAGAGTFNDYSIVLAGGRNAAAELSGFKPVNREQILAWDPDVILLNSFEPGLSTHAVTGDSLLNLTKAARTGRVYLMPIGGYRWDPPSHESPLSWLWLAERFHAISQDMDVAGQVDGILKTLYGSHLTPEIRAAVSSHFDAREAQSSVQASR